MSTATLIPPTAVPLSKTSARRLLLVAYNFPPVGGAGVQRPVKWAKYLRHSGWDVTVLTTLNPSVPARDESLLSDLPSDVDVVRARTWEPGYAMKQNLINDQAAARRGLFRSLAGTARGLARRCARLALQPDPQVLWNYHAIREGTRVLRERSHDAILVTAPAYSSFYIGSALKRRFGLPLVLDFRDEWDLSGQYLENAQRDWFSRFVQSQMQRDLLRRADAVIATTGRSTEALAGKLKELGHDIPACCIYNGFDEEDFDLPASPPRHSPGEVTPPRQGTFRLVYTGTLWNLTDIEPLVRAIEHLNAFHPELAQQLELVCVGRKTPDQLESLQRLRKTRARLVCADYCDHSTALQWMRSASALCLLLSDVPGSERVVPAKLFEYLAMRKDLLAICPSGETAEIVRRFFPLGQITPGHVSPIADWLRQRLASATPENLVNSANDAMLREFSRASQTNRLADVLNSLVTCR